MTRTKPVSLFLSVACFLFSCAITAQCKVVYVKTDGIDTNSGLTWATAKKTVAAGISTAVSGDEVWAAKGIYVECITLKSGVGLYGGFDGSETTRQQRNWNANLTVLDGNKAGSVVTSPATATSTTVIDGFTIQNGKSTSHGGGIYCTSSPTISNNTITGNTTSTYGNGGGIYCSSCTPKISNNTITGCSSYAGGGIYCASSSPTISYNVITGNSGNGGGISCSSSSPAIRYNVIAGNSGSGGGGIWCASSSSPTISDNLIAGNCSNYAGGVYCDSSSPTITNNTITANNCSGIYCVFSSSPTISNNIVAFNSSGISGNSGTPVLRNNDVYNPDGYNYQYFVAGTGDISLDPKFADRQYGNFHIQPDSPCRDAGWNSAPGLDATDIDKQTRTQGGTVDIGSDESNGTLWSVVPVVVRVDGTNGADGNDGSSWALAKKTVQSAIDRASALGGEVWVKAGTYSERIKVEPFAYVYGGFAGAETAREQRNRLANVTVLDAGAGGRVVNAKAGYMVAAIDGFTIQNGKSTDYGGGILCEYCSLTISNSTIVGNTAPSGGGGISCNASSPTISNNTITGNSAGSQGGGGIYCYSSSSTPTISHNTITGNTASAYGGGICCSSSSPTISSNVIDANTSPSGSGGGVYSVSASPTIVNNTIVGNTSADGGGVYCSGGSPALTNNIVTFNSSGVYKGSGTPILGNNDVSGNTSYNYSGLSAGSGDISSDPMFADRAGKNYHLVPSSPCINAGSNAYIQPNWVDIDGRPRVMDGDADIGADEFEGALLVPTPGFSIGGGAYTYAQSVKITCPWPGVAIHYTTNGIDPTDSDPVVSGPIAVSISMTLKAKAWVDSSTSSKVKSAAYALTALAPTFSPSGGTYSTATNVTVNCSTPGAVIHYTTNGKVPTETDPVIGAGSSVRVAKSLPLTARAFKTGWNPSPTLSADYIVTGNSGAVRVKPDGSDNNDGLTWDTAMRTVQGGINACVSGMEVWVAAGTYNERITLKKGVSLYGGFAGTESLSTERNWAAHQAILDGNQGGSVVTAPSGATTSTRIDGFSIRNGKATNGGGVYCSSSSPTISNNIIADNTATDYGGGIYCYSSTANISNNVIASNVITNNSYGTGAGIYCSSSSPAISNNTIISNTGCYGGGICFANYGGTTAVSNNIIAFNSSGISPYGATLRNNDVYGNTLGDYSPSTARGTGDISLDPQIVMSAGGIVHIQPTSPCRDAGYNSAPGVPSTDFDGQARTEGIAVDIGADESFGETWNTSAIHVAPNGDDGNDGLSWSLAKKTVKAGISACAPTNEVWVATGTYTENITLKNCAGLYGGFSGTETSRSERNWTLNQTILDGNQAGSVVTATFGTGVSTVIDGFTVRNGKASNGGGIDCGTSSPTVSNNTITGNTASVFGGGIRCGSSATISNNVIMGNTASSSISGSTCSGGGVYCYGSVTLSNNIIAENTAKTYGGGVYCPSDSPMLTSNTIVSNSASAGGAIYCGMSTPAISNNIAAYNSSGIVQYDNAHKPVLRNNDVYANAAYNYSGNGLSAGTGDISSDPLFADRAGKNYHLLLGSPCINTGANAYVQADWVDMDGQPRVMDGDADIGADEFEGALLVPTPGFNPGGGAYTSAQSVTITCPWPGVVIHYTTNGIDPTESDPVVSGPVAVDISMTLKAKAWADSSTFSKVKSATYTLTTSAPWPNPYGGTYSTAKDVVVSCYTPGAVIHYTTNGKTPTETDPVIASGSSIHIARSTPLMARAWKTGWNPSSTLSTEFIISGSGSVIRVRPDGNDDNDGLTWDSAKKTVQASINACVSGMEVWISKGTYTENVTLKNGVALYGGFAGTELARTERNWTANRTILDGNHAGAVITAYSSTTIDGLIIRNGNANYGGGICCSGSSCAITNNTIASNTANYGGGIYSSSLSTTISNNSIVSNSASKSGGGIYNSSTSTISNNTIAGNISSINGGGVYCDYSSSTAANNIVAFNSSGVCSSGCTLRNNCVFGNQSYNYFRLSAGTGDISSDPLFVDQSTGNYHLSAASPCVNAGWNNAPGLTLLDIDGQTRVQGGTADIGADEYWPTVSDAKKAATQIGLSAVTITAAFPGFFYIESDDRSSGIRVDKPAHGLKVGTRVDVDGTLGTNSDGERAITAGSITVNGAGSIAPLLTNNKTLGGGWLGLQGPVWGWVPVPQSNKTFKPEWLPSAGLSNIGLLIKTYGNVTYSGDGCFYIDDGSGLDDNSGHKGVRVYGSLPLAEGVNPIGKHVTVTGISSCEKVANDPVRVIRTRGAGDVKLEE